MRFAFAVKHNGILYPAGQEVPIGKEVVDHNDEIETLTANDIREKLKKLGVKKFPSNKKEDLLKQLKEAEAAAEEKSKEAEKEEEEEKKVEDPIKEPETDKEEGKEEGDSTLLEKIINNEE